MSPHRKRVEARNRKYLQPAEGHDRAGGHDTTVTVRRQEDSSYEVIRVDRKRIDQS